MEGNLCWNCRYLVTCSPQKRPSEKCENYKPLGRVVSQQHIADMIGISRNQLLYILSKYGTQKVIEMLDIRGYKVRFEVICRYIRFYDLTNYSGEKI